MRTSTFSSAVLRAFLQRRKAATMAELKEALGTTVDMTVLRKLQPLGCVSSYSQRGKFYTLREVAQFEHIATQRRMCAQREIPLISVDTKKKELVGLFKNAGIVWGRQPRAVRDHDFRSEGIGMAIPYGIYDVEANRGAVFVGTSQDTADFALDAILAWWRTEGSLRYANAAQVFILADNGGSNGSNHHAWKYALQHKLADPFGITVTVCHYPPATSKWNPIEHRLFAQISQNWAGEPLVSYETIVNFIRTTTTDTGLRVTATMLEGDYPTGVKIPKREIKRLSIEPDTICPQWNYTVRPRPAAKCEVIS
jgi:hypothetical protein